MSVPVWSVVKFKIKEGCEDDFLAAALDEALEPRPAEGAAVSDLQISAVVRFLLWS